MLDFARPIRFEFSRVNLNALCTDAITAATAEADNDGPSVRTTLDPELDGLITDGERLRLTLVNILTNARHSVLERRRQEGNGTLPPGPAYTRNAEIELRTEAVSDSVVAIRIRDRGLGIAADDLSKVFDPYFTTKRTGSGLGLAIAKNVVDGLGGTITVNSQGGEGPEMRIELPRQTSAAGAT